MNKFLIDTHIQQIFGGISTLTSAYPSHAVPILVLVYSAIDQLSWLVADEEKHGPDDFKAWVNKYLNPEQTLNCTADQMWAARNGILHMGTAESVNTRKGVKKICYFIGRTQVPKHDDYIYVDLSRLIDKFMRGAMEFNVEIKNSERCALAERKLQNVLLLCGVE